MDLADADLLRIWETMRSQSLPRRAAALLAAATPDAAPGQWASLSLGESERRLLGWRTRAFGPVMACVCDCDGCGETFEFELDGRALAAGLPAVADRALHLDRGGYGIEITPPTIGDCVAVADTADAAQAHAWLMQRCIRATAPDGTAVDARLLPDEVVQEVDAALAAADSAAELQLSLACPACGRTTEAPLDVAAFCWSEIETRAPRLLAEVHLLASRYGWHEADILAMSRVRRDRYLELVLS